MKALLWVVLAGASFLALETAAMGDDRKADNSNKPAPGVQKPQKLDKEITVRVRLGYHLFLPEQYQSDGKPWPLLIFLHGAGETGTDLELVKKHGPPKIVETRKDFPFVVVSPQAPSFGWKVEALNSLLDEILAKYNVDPDRVYLTGLSMGGYGTWLWAAANPERFAAIAPICGGGNVADASKLKDLPIWVFHGAKDSVVPLKRSQEMVDALKKAGREPKFTVYPEAEHDSWTETYNNPELYSWLLQQKRDVLIYKGTWQGGGTGHGGDLHCVARKVDGDNYSAVFSGYCGREYAFQISMKGKKEGNRIVFAGEVDLGEKDGGVYQWTGELVGNDFNGKYATAKGKKGEFTMKLENKPAKK